MDLGTRKGSYRCSICSINYPVHTQFVRCLVCEERTSHVGNIEVHEDWLDRVTDAILTMSGGMPNTIPAEWSNYGEPPQEA